MTKNLPIPTGDLPESLIDIAETLGIGVAIKLIEHFGGLEVKFPPFPPADHPVIKALGETDGYALCSLLSGTRIYVPHGRPRRSVKSDVRALEAQGLDRAGIARELGISQRHVRRVSNANDPDPAQLSFFDDD